jgi:hypothetical protein
MWERKREMVLLLAQLLKIGVRDSTKAAKNLVSAYIAGRTLQHSESS